MHLLFLCGGYFPDTSATGNCVRQIADRFTQNGDQVSVICKNSSPGQKEEFVRGQCLYRITNLRLSDGIRLTRMKKSFLQRTLLFFYKCFWAVYGLLMNDGMDRPLVKAYYKACKKVGEKGKIDAIIPCCMPAECLKAALSFAEENEIPLFPLLYDLYSDNKYYFRFAWNQKLKYNRAAALEKRIFTSSKRVFYVDNWRHYFEEHPHPNALRVEHPLVVKRTVTPCGLEKRTAINTIYQGEVNYQMRPPEAMLRMADYFSEHHDDISLHICAYGNMVSEIIKYASKDPHNIFFYGTVKKDRADALYDSSDVAVILANKDPEIVPSKIFECIASGYPIVYFYYSETEKSYRLLEKYPLVYYIKQGDLSAESYEKAAGWIHTHYQDRIAFEEIADKYDDATPDFVVDEIAKHIKDEKQR